MWYDGSGLQGRLVGGEQAEEDFDVVKVDDIILKNNHPAPKESRPNGWEGSYLTSLSSWQDMIALVKELKKLKKERGGKVFKFEVRDDDEFQINFVLTKFPRAARGSFRDVSAFVWTVRLHTGLRTPS